MYIESYSFPSKILLFGEQTVLTGSQALSIPFDTYSGVWKYGNKIDPALQRIVEQLPKDIVNIDFFQEEINKHLIFHSTIPQKAGLGSSGALTAAIYKCFSTVIKSTLKEIQQDLAIIESVFHGKSSGTDALVSFANQSIHTANGVSSLIDLNLAKYFNYVSLINSNTPRSSKEFINLYLDKVEEGSIDHQLLISKSDAALASFISNGQDFMQVVKELSVTQLREFSSFIPASMLDFWNAGIKEHSYYCKLCGAGGGGYFLCFSAEPLKKAASIIPVNY